MDNLRIPAGAVCLYGDVEISGGRCSSSAVATRSLSTSIARPCTRSPVRNAWEIVPGATHLFTEPGALEQVARLATDWFTRYLTKREGAIVNE
jgi:hypothetical protein